MYLFEQLFKYLDNTNLISDFQTYILIYHINLEKQTEVKQYVYLEKQKVSWKSTGYGKIIDTQIKSKWENEVQTIHGKKTAILIINALNLMHDLSRLSNKRPTKE